MSTPNEMRKFLSYMRNLNENKNETSKEVVNESRGKKMTMRDMLGRMRSLKEQQPNQELTTPVDQKNEEDKMSEFFADNNVKIEFEPLEIYDNGVFWGGTIDGQIQWVYKVTPTEEGSGVEVNYLDQFNAKDPENEEIIEKLENYYDEFYKYWRDNELDN